MLSNPLLLICLGKYGLVWYNLVYCFSTTGIDLEEVEITTESDIIYEEDILDFGIEEAIDINNDEVVYDYGDIIDDYTDNSNTTNTTTATDIVEATNSMTESPATPSSPKEGTSCALKNNISIFIIFYFLL